MKKSFFLSILSILIIALNAQSLAPTGAQWNFSLRSNFNSTVEPYTLQMSTDTFVFGRTARFASIVNPRLPLPCPAGLEYGYLSESNDSIFIYEDNRWQMLVNFNANPLDTFSILISVSNPSGTQTAYSRLYIQVDSVRTDTINSVPLKSVYLKRYNSSSSASYTFFDGWFTQRLGSQYSFIPWVNSSCYFGNYYVAELRCYADGNLGNVQFSNYACNAVITNLDSEKDFDKTMEIFPNPSNGLINIKTEEEIKSIQVFNMQGQVIQNFVTLSTSAISVDSGVEVKTKQINLPEKSGLYLLKIETKQGQVLNRKIIRN